MMQRCALVPGRCSGRRCCSRRGALRRQSRPGPGVDWPQFRGIRAAGIDDTPPRPVDLGRRARTRRCAGRPPIPGLGHSSPVVWGDTVYRRHVDQRAEGRRPQGRAVRRHRRRSRTTRRTSGASTRSTRRPARSAGSARCSPRAQDQAAHQGDARQFDARHRRRADHRVLRLRRPLRLRHEGQAALEEGSRRPRRRLLRRPRRAVGDRQLADPARRRRRRAGRRAEGLVPRRVRREGRQGAVAQDRATTCRRGARRRSTRSTAARSCSSTACATSAPTTSRPAR